jgi:hypothetical protein
MKQNAIRIFGLGALVGASFLAGFAFTGKDHDTPVEVKQDGRLQYKWYPPELPKSMEFAGERVPLNHWDVKERLDREMIVNYYRHAHTLEVLKLANRIFPAIEERLKANGIPEDFKYLCVAESSLRNPTSKAGAVGYWQFMEATAKHYGLEVDNEVDERYDLVKSTDAACSYLKDAYEKFGNWTAAAASYNCGMGGYSSRSDFQMSKNYYDLWLPGETNRYVFRILALKTILENPKEYGFYIPGSEVYKPVMTWKKTVTESIPDLAAFAIENGTNYKILRILNPWLRSRSLTISKGNSYVIKFPAIVGKQ